MAHDQRQFTVHDDVRCLLVVHMLGVKSVRAVLPDIAVEKSFPLQSSASFFPWR